MITRRIFVCMMCVVAPAVLLVLGHGFLVRAAATATSVCGTLNSDTTWTAAGSPYEVCPGGVTVAQSASLTVSPGVTVQFLSGGRLTVSGEMVASGTPTQPITFTGVVTTPGSWSGILGYNPATTPARITLNYVTLEYGGISSYYGAQVYADNSYLTMTHSLVRSGAGSGIYHEGDAAIVVHGTHFEDNANDAVRIVSAARGLDLGGLTAAGNGRDVVHIASTSYLSGRQHLPAPGLPYMIDAVIGNQAGDSLTIDPGNELQFSSSGYLNIGGELKAIGLPGEPITLTGQTKTPGAWIGLVVYGGQTPANAQLEYTTVEYGGRNPNGANVSVTNGFLLARYSKVRSSQYDGVQFNSQGMGSLLNSQIEDNAVYGVRNAQPTRQVLATNNWWGDPSGPDSDQAICGPGAGERITAGILFKPVLTDTSVTAPFPLSDTPNLTLAPRRWFAPADGSSRVYFDITLTDGNGAPLPGRTVRLLSSLGVVSDGGVTDTHGRTLAYLVSNVAGDADVSAALDATACEGAMSPTATVTFTEPLDITELFPDSAAPYLERGISVSPLPVIVGVPTTIQVRLKNPLPEPITVDVSFGFAQSSVGLAFGPIKDIVGLEIAANDSMLLSADWLPVLSGHYCVQVTYNITAVGGSSSRVPLQGGSGRSQFNLSAQPGPMGSPNDKAILDRADKSWNRVSKLAPRGRNIQVGILTAWWNAIKRVAGISSESLGGDPPRQDYAQPTLPIWSTTQEVQPNASISPARAAAINAASAALADAAAYGTAAALALDRYAGASEAEELTWAAQQASARLYYEQEMGYALLVYADRLEDFIQVLIDESETGLDVTRQDVVSYQQSLAADGFTAQEIADYRLAGLTDAQIEAYLQEIIAADPDDLAGNILDFYTEEADISRELGAALLQSSSYSPGLSVGGSPGLRAPTASGNAMAQIDNTVVTLQVGNPLTQTAVIDLQARRIELPADWMVSVSPAQVTLAPGEQTTATVTVLTGSLVQQGAQPQVAVEGYAGDLLLGGVVVEIVVPQYVIFDGNARLYLPLMKK